MHLMTGPLIATELRTWRPQAFGRRHARDVPDPIIEPLWSGERILLTMASPDAEPEFHDTEGEPLEGTALEAIAADLRQATRTWSFVLDGYLTRQATMPERGTDQGIATPSAGQLVGQLMFGRRLAEAVSAKTASQEAATDPSLPVCFVAVDLLAIDDDPLLDVPLLERKRILDGAFEERALVRRTPFIRPPVKRWMVAWRGMGFREVAYKAANSRYTPGRPNRDWAAVAIPRE
jgi:hypothetical protein